MNDVKRINARYGKRSDNSRLKGRLVNLKDLHCDGTRENDIAIEKSDNGL